MGNEGACKWGNRNTGIGVEGAWEENKEKEEEEEGEEKETCHKCVRTPGAYERHYETLDSTLTEIIETKSSIVSAILFATI